VTACDSAPTFRLAKDGSGSSRIDYIFANSAALSTFRAFSRPVASDAGHDCWQAQFNLTIAHQYKWVPSIPKPISLKECGRPNPFGEESCATADNIWCKHEDAFNSLLAEAVQHTAAGDEEASTHSVTFACEILSDASQQYLLQIAADRTGMPHTLAEGDKRMRPMSFKRQRIAAPSIHTKPQLGAASVRMLKLDKLLRALEQLAAKEKYRQQSISPSAVFLQQHENLIRNCTFAARRLDISIGTSGRPLVDSIALVTSTITDESTSRKKQRLQKWSAKMHHASLTQHRDIYQFCKTKPGD
jgi:hypothetical protein